jgi:hypothetical protein
MAIAGIDPKCYILALFVRDDGVRFLLGDDPYEFKDKQLHFQPNTVANDVVEVQGNDGYLLAGQVRRPGTQSFDGYVCNGTNSKAEVEVKRREFLQFFRRSHFYKVIYVFPNGTAIQRKQGFLVDDPTVQELYQQYPEYHVALNFEDVNYYTYEEDDQGQEIYAKEAIVPLAGGGATGGLIWDVYGVVWDGQWSDLVSVSGSEIQIDNEAGARAPIQDLELQGDTYQQGSPSPDNPQAVQTVTGAQTVTVTGKNKFNINGTVSEISATRTVSENTLTATMSSTGGNKYVAIEIPNSSGLLGKTVTLSYTLKNISDANSARLSMYFGTLSNPARNVIFDGAIKGSSSVGENVERTVTIPGSLPASGLSIFILVYANTNHTSISTLESVEYSNIQLEVGSATSYEPYQSQSYEVNLGKNLFDKDNANVLSGYVGDGVITSNPYNRILFISCDGGTEYTIQKTKTRRFDVFYTEETPAIGTQIYGLTSGPAGNIDDTSVSLTYTTGAEAKFLCVIFRQTIQDTAKTEEQVLATVQIEKGPATSYAPYFTPIELCKISDYQDYIYKSGEDWYVHKETGRKIYFSSDISLDGNSYTNIKYAVALKPTDSDAFGEYGQKLMYCTHASATGNTGTWDSAQNIGKILSGAVRNYYWIGFPPNTTLDTMQAALDGSVLYYRLSTASDTKITDATLVGQLEALGAMRLFIGENNLLVSSTGTNLPATLEFSYPTKFAAIGAEWEEGGTKGATIVDVNAIDNTYPVWELMGPAVNPTISVLTTNTTLTYNGTITASQKLVIDMFNKTATLNGTSVIGNVSGDFVYMAPGTNRIAYTAGNTDAPDSTIYWQEVVG